MVRQASAIEESDGADEARGKVSGVIAGIDDADFIEEQVASVIGMSGTPPVPGEIFWAIRSFFEAVARDRPLVMVFDDIHWAETTLLDLIEHLATSSRGVPLLVICMARPDLLEQRLGWGGGRMDATNLTLTSLGREESSRLVDNLLGSGELDEADRERILEAGEGHPLFLEELVAMLIEEDLLQWRDGRWVTSANLGEVPIPPTVQALIAARIDRLGASERAALEHASVVGHEFTERNLSAFGTDRERVAPVLDALETKDLVLLRRESPSAGRTFRFRHHLIRDVVYRAMPKAARADAHEAFGDQLETGAGGRVAELEEILGYHFEAAYRYRTELRLQGPGTSSLATRAASHLRSAGARAFARDDNPAAASLLGRALALLDTGDGSRADVAWQLGAALFETGALGRAEAALDEGLRDAHRLGTEVAEWRIRLEQTDIRFWRIPEAASTLEIERFAIDAIRALQRLGDLGGVARAQRLLGDALGRRGNLAEAVEAYESGRRLAREVGDEREATQRSNLGVAHGPLPVDRCIEIARRNLAEARRPVPETLAGLGFLLAMTGSFDESRKAFEDAVARAVQLGIEWRLASINMHYGAAMLYADDPTGAEAVLRPAVEALQEMGEQSMFSTAAALLGEALYRLGRMDDALAAADASAETTAEDDVASQMAWRGVRAKVLAAAGDLTEAEQLAREGVSYADRSDLLNMAGDAHFDLGVVLEAADRHIEATAQFEAAAGLYSRKGNTMSTARAHRASASVHTGAGAGS
jgi:tetratricopeptide (TPR) repeat protein